MNIHKNLKKLQGHFLSFKFPMRILGLLTIVFFTAAMGLLTYRGGVEIWGFFKMEEIAKTLQGKITSQMIGWMMAAATFIQSGPVIWNKLSYWGQIIDNHIYKLIFHKSYFLDEVEILLQETRNLIDCINSEFLDFARNSHTDNQVEFINKKKLHKALNIYLEKIEIKRRKILELLKNNEPTDHVSRQKKDIAKGKINAFTTQLTNIYEKNKKLNSQLKGDCENKK